MKTTLKVIALLILAGSFVSCENIKSLADVDFDTTVQTNLNLASDGGTTKSSLVDYSFSGSATLNPTNDPEVQKYIDKIKDYAVKSITLTVTSVSEPGVKILKDSYFKIHDTGDEVTWTLDADFDVEIGNSYTLSNTTGDYATVQKILRKNSTSTVSGEGYTNIGDVTITLDTKIEATITANPL
jgi:hypothetical protein